MIKVRRSQERGYEDKGWLQTYHTFSFDTYFDQRYMFFRDLRVINQDRVKGGKGFASHSHRDMEILTYVLEGALEHKDSLGSTSIIRPGEVQRMSAGSGVTHSEYNLSHQLPVHFLQIWINPDVHGIEPSYAKRVFSSASKWGQWCLICSQSGREGSLRIHQDVDLYATLLDEKEELRFETLSDRFYWVQIVSGQFTVQGMTLDAGDGAQITEEDLIQVQCRSSGELLLFDLR
jgi:redox-sensitive bicupin YhaK (pirin superfamily)